MNMITAAQPVRHPADADFVYHRPLELSDIDEILALQQKVYDGLSAEQKSFIVLKDAEKFKTLLSAPHHGVGYFNSEHKLVGQAFLAVLKDGDLQGHLTDSWAARFLARLHINIGVIEAVWVDKAYRKHGLMGCMLAELEQSSQARGDNLKAFIGEVAKDNWQSIKGFWHQLFEFAGDAVDPTDGTLLIFLAKRLQIGTNPIGNP